jgi:tRNA (cytidine/uridine-2'-O-)-methyltransferase
LDDRHLRRAGLDYWPHVQWEAVDHWKQLLERLPAARLWLFSRFAQRCLWDSELTVGDGLVFGSESAGLPASLREAYADRALVLPTDSVVRSLNLATTVGVALFELVRRQRAGV